MQLHADVLCALRCAALCCVMQLHVQDHGSVHVLMHRWYPVSSCSDTWQCLKDTPWFTLVMSMCMGMATVSCCVNLVLNKPLHALDYPGAGISSLP